MAFAHDRFHNKDGSVGRNRAGRVDKLAPVYYVASWKGVEFLIDSSSDEFGRRGDVYEYPFGEYVGYKDLGRRARRFKCEGYLIGQNQMGLTVRMRNAAEDPEPGTLVHPIYGEQLVACVTLTITADYRKDKKRTKLSFEFVEANPSWSPYAAGTSVESLYQDAMNAANLSAMGMGWNPNSTDVSTANDISTSLSDLVAPGIDENSFDAIGMLRRHQTAFDARFGEWPAQASPSADARFVPPKAYWRDYQGESFKVIIDPISFGSATIRRIHTDALDRLRDFNAYVVSRSTPPLSDSVQQLVLTTRLIVIRDYATVAARKTYTTVRAALDDLDFIMAVYDEEEEWAARKCDDALVTAIRKARASATGAILVRNIRLPGIAEFSIDGLWPSLVAAQKLYADGRRYQQIEDYNPTMLPFWMGRRVQAPTA